ASGIFHVILTSGRWFYLNGTNNGTTLTFAPAVPPGDSIPANAKLYSDSGWTFAAYLYGSVVAADQVTPNTFYGVNFYAGLMKWTNCGTPVSIANINNSGWTADGNFNSTLKAVPGEAGHLFFTVGPVGSGGSAQPASSRLWRMCNASSAGANGATWQSVPGMYEPVAFGFGAPAPGKNYPTEYVVGWYDTSVNTGGNGSINNAQYGIWESTDDPNHGVTSTCDVTAGHQTWTNIGASQNAVNGLPLGWYTNVNDISGDPFVHGPVYFAGGFGMFYGIFP
ncbi:MAG TPA: hypothetical protein VMU27_02090, partial [Candidatus Paceibacterota bacterium]|nr:hypothetical protein [Candidatus Paceibacterota bacterium]